MKSFSNDFEFEDFEDAADLVMATDMDIDATIEKAAEDEDDKELEPEELVGKLQEAGVIAYFTENESDYDHLEYHEEDDDAVSPDEVDAMDYCEAENDAEDEDLDEDDLIDAVEAEEVDDLIDYEETDDGGDFFEEACCKKECSETEEVDDLDDEDSDGFDDLDFDDFETFEPVEESTDELNPRNFVDDEIEAAIEDIDEFTDDRL